MDKISIIIPNFNGRLILAENLPSVVKVSKKYPEICEIIIVDDASTDGSLDFIRKQYPQIKVIEKNRHEGFVKSVNLGVRQAKGNWVFLLNSDVQPDIKILPNLTRHFPNENVFAIGCLDKSVEGKNEIMRGRGIGIFDKGLLLHQRGEVDKAGSLWVSGGSAVFRKSIWDKLGGLNELYSPFYWEDIDLSYRAQKSGYAIIFEPGAVVIHKHDTGSIRQHFSSREITAVSLRNQIIFVWLNISDLNYLISHFFYLGIYLVRDIVKLSGNFSSSFIQAVFKLPSVIKYRIKSSKSWKKSDREILDIYRNEFLKVNSK